ncbi:hypothetical protein CYMTET_41340 [Cymbomonas tetramitiformis]|uniref:Right handed beta helix domain-containing protein n=1 Tax=Cymbomonas tetramitiformis TaxID=36881 RepID=A0AAE0F2M2_9CHLO|nr:hypothetical protein CYMTET_41340 [Cymbomonas tetramitiformis]
MIFFLLGAVFLVLASGNSVEVDSEGTVLIEVEANAADGLQAALNGDVDVNTVLLYTSFQVTAVTEVLQASVLIQGKCSEVLASAGTLCEIDAGGQTRIFSVGAGRNLTLHNLRLLRGYTSSDGGAVLLGENSLLHAYGCSLQDNVAEGSGGAVYCEKRASLYFSRSEVIRNSAGKSGGGLAGSENATLVVRDHSYVSQNLAGGHGGGIGCYDSSDGGSLAGGGCDVYLLNHSIVSNNTAGNGGGIQTWWGSATSNVGLVWSVSNVRIAGQSSDSNNHARTGHGGGVNVYLGVVEVADHSEVANNSAKACAMSPTSEGPV